MITIKAFKGVRPALELAQKVASRPYDVMNREEAKAEAKDNPHSFLHIIRSEIDLPDEVDAYDGAVYLKARENFEGFLKSGILIQDPTPYIYVYQQEMGKHVQTGIVACSSVQDYFDDLIKKHEFTRPVKEQDRINHIRTTGIHSGPVFLTYPDVAEIDDIVDGIKAQQPTYNFITGDGIRHVLWIVSDAPIITRLIELFKTKVTKTYIADGHHRAASSAMVGKQLAEENPNHQGDESYNFFLSVLFPSSQLKIIDYNRVVKDLNGLSEEEFTNAMSDSFTVEPQNASFKPQAAREFGMYLGGQWYFLKAKPSIINEDDPVECLDISILSKNLLDPILSIKDQRTDDRIDFVGGIRGLGELEKRVNSGEMKVAFSIYPITIDQLIRIADSGNVMPPKSTWFEPKLRSGLVVHKFK